MTHPHQPAQGSYLMQQALALLEEAASYTSCPTWSPSLTDEINSFVVNTRAALAAGGGEADEARRFAQAEAAKLKGEILKISTAISRAGFTLVRVRAEHGYEVRKFGPVVAQVAPPAPAIPPGFVLVPVEPTPKMLFDLFGYTYTQEAAIAQWRDMVSALAAAQKESSNG